MFGLLVTTITDVGHQHLTLEASAHSVVNTSGLPPVFLKRSFILDQRAARLRQIINYNYFGQYCNRDYFKLLPVSHMT